LRDAQHIGQRSLDGQAAPQRRAHQRADDPDHGDQQGCGDQHQNRVGHKGQNAAEHGNLADEVNDGSQQVVGQRGNKYRQTDQQEFGQAQQTGRCRRREGAYGLVPGLVHEHDADARRAGQQRDDGRQHEDQVHEEAGLDQHPGRACYQCAGQQQCQKAQQQRSPLSQSFGGSGKGGKTYFSQGLLSHFSSCLVVEAGWCGAMSRWLAGCQSLPRISPASMV
jgi:hypothetical protein